MKKIYWIISLLLVIVIVTSCSGFTVKVLSPEAEASGTSEVVSPENSPALSEDSVDDFEQDNEAEIQPVESYAPEKIENYVPPEASAAVTEEISPVYNISDAYKNVLFSFSLDEDTFASYYLCDMNGDNVDELIVYKGTCEADAMLYLYYYDGKNAQLFEELSGSHCALFDGGDRLYIMYAHMGYEEIVSIILTGNGAVQETVMEPTEITGDYIEPENSVRMEGYETVELSPLERLKNEASG